MKIIIFLLGFLLTSFSFADPDPFPNNTPGIFIFHISGINTKAIDAFKNLEALETHFMVKLMVV